MLFWRKRPTTKRLASAPNPAVTCTTMPAGKSGPIWFIRLGINDQFLGNVPRCTLWSTNIYIYIEQPPVLDQFPNRKPWVVQIFLGAIYLGIPIKSHEIQQKSPFSWYSTTIFPIKTYLTTSCPSLFPLKSTNFPIQTWGQREGGRKLVGVWGMGMRRKV